MCFDDFVVDWLQVCDFVGIDELVEFVEFLFVKEFDLFGLRV